MSKVKMNEDRIREIVLSYGANAAHWPANERQEAEAFLSKSPQLKSLVDDARGVDLLLDAAPTPAAADDAFIARVISVSRQPQVAQNTQSRSATFSFGAFIRGLVPAGSLSLLPQAASIAIAGFLGVYMGLSDIQRPTQSIEMVDASSLIFENPGLKADLKEFE